jgi:hypothetical protein
MLEPHIPDGAQRRSYSAGAPRHSEAATAVPFGAPGGRGLPNPRYRQGLGCGVGRSLGIGVGRGVEVGVTVGVGVALGLGVAVGVGVGVGVPTAPLGAWISTVIGEPVLKKPTVALSLCGGASASNRKLYSVPQRIALAF